MRKKGDVIKFAGDAIMVLFAWDVFANEQEDEMLPTDVEDDDDDTSASEGSRGGGGSASASASGRRRKGSFHTVDSARTPQQQQRHAHTRPRASSSSNATNAGAPSAGSFTPRVRGSAQRPKRTLAELVFRAVRCADAVHEGQHAHTRVHACARASASFARALTWRYCLLVQRRD